MQGTSDDWQRAKHTLEMIQQSNLEGLGIEAEDNMFDISDEKSFDILRTIRSDIFGAMSDDELRGQLAEIKAASDGLQPSKYEHAGLYQLISGLLDQIYRAMEVMGAEIPERPVFGTLRTGRVNGMAIAVEDTPVRIIVLEHGLFGFANLMCKAIAMAIPPKESSEGKYSYYMGREETVAYIANNPEPSARFFDALCSYVISGDPHRAAQYTPGPQLEALASVFRDSMELFILGHELGHVINGHLEGALVRCALPGDVETFEISTEWKQEFEADLFGITVAVQAQLNNGLDLPLSYLGADLFFSCVDIVERAVGILADGRYQPRTSPTHPPTVMRRELTRHWLKAECERHPDQARGAVEFSDLITEVVEMIWTRIEPSLIEMHREGVRPASWFH